MRNKGKVGGIVDKRFGESDSNLTPEEKMLERFTKEQQVIDREVYRQVRKDLEKIIRC